MAIIFDTLQKELTVRSEENLLEACVTNKIQLSHVCEGMASCGTCRVIITSGVEDLPQRNSLEQEMADDRGFADNERLACQLPLKSQFQFTIPPQR